MSCVLWEIMVEGEMCSHAGWGWAQSSNHMQRRGQRDEEVLHLSVRAGCITLIPSPCFLLVPIVCLTHVSSVPCHLSSRIRVMNHLHLGHFWNHGHKKRREPIAVAPSQMGTKPCCSGFTRQTDITVARDVPPSWAGVDVPVSKDTAHQACLKKELKKVMARAHSQL